jgi:hypothetical protein
MPDITMCKGENCTIKNECYRFTATPDKYRQAYFAESPCTKKMGGTSCDHYVPNRSNK